MPPFKQVLTHGFVVKPDGTKVSKSDKEYVTATKEVDDARRGSAAAVDAAASIIRATSPPARRCIKEFGDKYRKIRNTLRYLLSNLYDFNPQTDSQAIPPNSLDGWAIDQLDTLITEVTARV